MADSLIYDLCKAVCELFVKTTSLLHDVPEEAKKIEQNLVYITTVLKAAEQREIEADLKVWLSDVKNLAYDIEDVLDDWTIAELQMADEAGTSQQGTNFKAKVLSPVVSSSYVRPTQLKSRHHISQRIISINKNLGEIVERKNRFNFLTSNNRINEGPELQPTSAYGDYAVVRSQEEVKAKVIQMLVDGDSKGNVANINRIPIISLVGMGGIGKTTLARLVHNDDNVEGHFSKTIWVGVSKPFDEMNVAKAIAGGLGLNVTNEGTPHLVLSKIDKSVRGLKFLLVLDDVWEDSEGKWSGIFGCLGKADTQGSRILLTTRNSELSKKMGADIVSVEELCAEDAWSLFSYYAFRRDSGHREFVKDIGEKLAEKCHGLPLALQILGSHMASKTTRSEWEDVLWSVPLKQTKLEDCVFNSLAVSYVELPSAAKRCFAFCSIFPKGTVMTKFNLIRLWMAQGYLQGCKPDQMEVLGEKFFESLERRSFFRVSEIRVWELADIAVTMHDIVHDFAHYISNGEVAILDPSLEIHEGGVISEKLRHLAIRGEKNESHCPYSTFDFNSLRTLFLSSDSIAVLNAVCSNISDICALAIHIYSNSMTPVDYHFKDIGKLEHLRYLRLGTNKLSVLPKEICGLPYLQTLDLREFRTLKTLPDEIGRLTTLRHLLFDIENELGSFPKGLGKLSSLQTLSYFSCSALDNESCSSIEALRDLNNVRGELQLRKLNNVANVNEVTRAELRWKRQIRKLCLEFGDGDASLQSEVLEALQPAEGNLEFLEIKKHSGRRCPQWIGKMLYLKEVLLEDVSMESLPEMGMLRFLEKLSICRAHEVKHVGTEFFGTVEPDKGFFPELTGLKFAMMCRWEHWEGPDVRPRNGVPVTIMPSLRCLSIDDCDALQTLPRFLEHVPLESLNVYSERLPLVEPAKIDYPNRWQIGDILLPQTMEYIQSPYLTFRIPATEVSVRGQHDVITIQWTAIPRYIFDLTYLRRIVLNNIKDESLPPFGLLPSLLELTIRDAHNVGKVGDEFLGMSSNNTTAAFVVVFPRLEKLTFQMMSAWREWEDPVYGGNINLIMRSLCHLSIRNCKKLKSLPHLFDSVPLQTLDVAADDDEEGGMVRIRNSSRMDEATVCKTIITSAATLPQPELREITLSGVKNDWVLDWTKYCKGLRKLTLSYDCGVASLASLELLPSLEFLEISSGDIRHIGKDLLQSSSLLHLDLRYMDDLEEWEEFQLEISDESRELSRHGNNNGSAKINFMPNLRCLSIFCCPKLKALPSCLRSGPLEELEIADCPGLATWWINEAGEDWRNWKSGIPRFKFRVGPSTADEFDKSQQGPKSKAKAKSKFSFPGSNIRINEGPKLQAATAYGAYTVVRRQEEVKAEVIQMLVHGDSKGNVANGNPIPTISLVGMGGIGKTTLARLVYNDDSVMGHFSKTIWVRVSKPFNEMNVAKGIAGGLGLDVKNESTSHLVLSKIDKSIRGLKFLLVLDDVWEDSEGKWSDILDCLGKGDKQGSRILMTTRNLVFSKKMGEGIVLGEALCAEDARLLFSYYAFIGDSDHHEEVKDIAEKLVEKCHGLPLALEVLGRHMATKSTRREWDDVLRSELWKTEIEGRVFNSLAVSYVELPSAAKRCFAFCSIFPKGTVMTKFNLIRLWMAQGYLEGCKPDQMEVLGEECFKSLEMQSFIRVSYVEIYFDEFADVKVTMHGLVHDFAHYVSDGEVAILDPSHQIRKGGVISEKIRHLAIGRETSESKFPYATFDFANYVSDGEVAILDPSRQIRKAGVNSEKIRRLAIGRETSESKFPYATFDYTSLRTLFLSCPKGEIPRLQGTLFLSIFSSVAVIEAVCSNKSYIRALDIESYFNSTRVEDIGKLVHLRYLRLGANNLTVLPKEICGLPYLQTLDVSRCFNVKTLPDEIGRLTSLRHLLLSESVPSLPKGLGKLSSLRTLNYFSCSDLDNDSCNSIEDLRGLNNLRGELRLKKLNNVANVDEAARADLHMKIQIRKLRLEFGDGDASIQSEVLEALQPAEGNLEFLEIKKHSGRRCPRWIGEMGHLKEVLLVGVSMDLLPEMGMLRFLEKLSICRAHEVKHVGTEFFGTVEPDKGFFPKLTGLEFAEMSRWEHWEGPNVITRSGVRVIIMPSLRCLSINACDALQTLPRFLEHVPLESLNVYGRSLPLVEPAKIDYPNRWQIGDILLPQTMEYFRTPYLTLRMPASKVSVHKQYDFITIERTLIPRYIMDLTYLRRIVLNNIKDESLPAFGLLPSLLELSVREAHNVGKVGDEFLGISSNNTTAAFVVVFPRLEKLSFDNMSAWREWEDPVHGGNINLAIMPSLCDLSIRGCEKLESLPHLSDSVALQTLDVSIIASAATLPQPELRELSRHGNNNGSAKINFMPNLHRLSISDCPKLEALPSFLKSAPLEELRILGCRRLQSWWWMNETKEDWRNWKSKIRRFKFRDSETHDGSIGLFRRAF